MERYSLSQKYTYIYNQNIWYTKKITDIAGVDVILPPSLVKYVILSKTFAKMPADHANRPFARKYDKILCMILIGPNKSLGRTDSSRDFRRQI